MLNKTYKIWDYQKYKIPYFNTFNRFKNHFVIKFERVLLTESIALLYITITHRVQFGNNYFNSVKKCFNLKFEHDSSFKTRG